MDLRDMLSTLDIKRLPYSFPTKNDALLALMDAELIGYQGIQFPWSMVLESRFEAGIRHIVTLPWNPVDILADFACSFATVTPFIDSQQSDSLFIMGRFASEFQIALEFQTDCENPSLTGTGVFLRIGPLVALHCGSWSTRTHILNCGDGRIKRRFW